MKLRHSARTDVGKTRDHNEDSYGVGEGEQAERMGELLVVCDGMGGHAAGEVASQLAVETILAAYYDDPSEARPEALERAFEQANAQVYARGRGSMGTTGVAALLHHDALHIANVGDSRAYLIRDGRIRQISRDHSFVNDQVAAGLITADQARSSPHRNVITRALGYQAEVTVDLFRWPLQIGDIIVLSSDGMHGLITDDEIGQIAGSMPIEQATERLIELANSRGGTDNITVVVAQVEALDWYGGEAEDTETPADDLHERTTVELPTSEVEVVESAPPAAAPAAAPPAAAAPAASPPARPVPVERRMSWLGGVLAAVLLALLASIIYFAMNTTPVIAPTSAPAPSAQATAAATGAPTAAPSAGPSATSAPATLPTSAPSALPSSAPAPSPSSAPGARPTAP